MDAITLLKQQHRHVEHLFLQAKNAEGGEKESIFLELADELSTHTSIEERVFYPRVMGDDAEEAFDKAIQEHRQVKRLLADMLDLDPDAERFDASMDALELQVMHHVSEEEDALFRKVAREFGKDVLEKLGKEMESLAQLLREAEPSEAEIGDPR